MSWHWLLWAQLRLGERQALLRGRDSAETLLQESERKQRGTETERNKEQAEAGSVGAQQPSRQRWGARPRCRLTGPLRAAPAARSGRKTRPAGARCSRMAGQERAGWDPLQGHGAASRPELPAPPVPTPPCQSTPAAPAAAPCLGHPRPCSTAPLQTCLRGCKGDKVTTSSL